MCGRYENASSNEELQELFESYAGTLEIAYDLSDILKEENIAPTNRVKVIVCEEGKFLLKVMKWGIRSKIFDPSRLTKGLDPNIEKDIFNSKIETVSKSAKWKKLFAGSRCLFPMTAFYEWVPSGGRKIPQRISLDKEKIFFAGGIFTDKDIKGEVSSSIITCEPNKFMKKVHNRMPALITPEDAGSFLEDNDAALQLCSPLDDSEKMKIGKAEI
ncbi:MAG: SOS response-associated peptidase [Ignavibacteria bacterium]|nr:SOS response-associated peptidase [Ignavibacteria bacterium]